MPNLNTLFPDDKSKEEAIQHFKSLANNPNWKFLIEKFIKTDIEEITEKILTTKFTDLATENDLKRRRTYWIILSQLPGKIIEALKTGQEDLISFDPYFSDVSEMAKEKEKK